MSNTGGGLLSWATSTLASVTTSVIAPFRSQSVETVPPEIHVGNEHNNPYAARMKQKRSKQLRSKQKFAMRKMRDEGEEESGEQVVEPPEPDEKTKDILARMAEAALERKREEEEEAEWSRQCAEERCAKLANSRVKDLPTDRLEEERAEVRGALAKRIEAVPAALRAETKFERMIELAADANKELTEIGRAIDEETRRMAKKTPRIPEEFQKLSIPELQHQIQDLEIGDLAEGEERVSEVELNQQIQHLRNMVSQANQREWTSTMEELHLGVSAARASINTLLDKGRDSESKERAMERLAMLYQTAAETSTGASAGGAKRSSSTVAPAPTATPSPTTAAPVNRSQTAVAPSSMPVGADVVCVPVSLTVAWSKLAPIVRKIERRFMCVVASPPRSGPRAGSSSAPSSSSSSSATVKLWGAEDKVQACAQWLRSADLSGNATKMLERKIAVAVIGRGGATIQQLEAETNTFLSMDSGTNQLVVFGLPEEIQKVWTAIEELKTDTRVTQQTVAINISPIVGRAIIAGRKPEVSALESRFNARITLVLQPDDKSSPRILVRAPADQLEAAKAAVTAELVEGLVVLEFTSSPKAVSRVLIPSQRGTGRAHQLNLQYKQLQQTHQLFVLRDDFRNSSSTGGRSRGGDQIASGGAAGNQSPGNNSPVEGDAAGDFSVDRAAVPSVCVTKVVCNEKDSEFVRAELARLLATADYEHERIAVAKEQLRVFTQENRKMVEASSGCQITVLAAQEDQPRLVLCGKPEEIAQAKQIIEQFLEEQGCMESTQLTAGLIDYLLRERGAVLRSLEDTHGVSIQIDRENKIAKLVGGRDALKNAVDDLEELKKQQEREADDVVRLVIAVDPESIPLIIGRNGQTVQQIRQIAGVQNVQIPPKTDTAAATGQVTLIGTSAGLEEAQAFIQELLGRSKNSQQQNTQQQNPDHSPSGPRNRGRGAQRNDSPNRRPPPVNNTPPAHDNSNPNDFPPLPDSKPGFAVAYGDS